MEIGRARGSGPGHREPAGVCGGRYASGRLGVVRLAWPGFGAAAEGDFEAEVADMVGDLPGITGSPPPTLPRRAGTEAQTAGTGRQRPQPSTTPAAQSFT